MAARKKTTKKKSASKKTAPKKTATKKTASKKTAAKSPAALRKLGDAHFRKNENAKAVQLYRMAAEGGDDDAAQNLAYLLRAGDGVSDEAEYARFLEQMVAEKRAWAVRELEGIAKKREFDRLRALRLPLSDEDKLRELAARFELGSHYERIRAASLPSVLLLGRSAEDASLAVGASKLGGEPDLPPGFEWPSHDGKPLTFLGQISLSEMQSVVPQPSVPESGQLAFFYDVANQPWGSPGERGAWRVAFAPSSAELQRHPTPKGVSPIRAFVLDAHREMSLPYPRTVAARDLVLSDEEFQRYVALCSEYAGEYCRQPAASGDVHRFLGHPDALQGDMSRRLEYALRDKDINVADPETDAAAREWRFLFQVGSDFNQGLSWGDNGRLFFWIREADLRARRFDEVSFQLQCH